MVRRDGTHFSLRRNLHAHLPDRNRLRRALARAEPVHHLSGIFQSGHGLRHHRRRFKYSARPALYLRPAHGCARSGRHHRALTGGFLRVFAVHSVPRSCAGENHVPRLLPPGVPRCPHAGTDTIFDYPVRQCADYRPECHVEKLRRHRQRHALNLQHDCAELHADYHNATQRNLRRDTVGARLQLRRRRHLPHPPCREAYFKDCAAFLHHHVRFCPVGCQCRHFRRIIYAKCRLQIYDGAFYPHLHALRHTACRTICAR